MIFSYISFSSSSYIFSSLPLLYLSLSLDEVREKRGKRNNSVLRRQWAEGVTIALGSTALARDVPSCFRPAWRDSRAWRTGEGR
jgi:hypothetical protein